MASCDQLPTEWYFDIRFLPLNEAKIPRCKSFHLVLGTSFGVRPGSAGVSITSYRWKEWPMADKRLCVLYLEYISLMLVLEVDTNNHIIIAMWWKCQHNVSKCIRKKITPCKNTTVLIMQHSDFCLFQLWSLFLYYLFFHIYSFISFNFLNWI